MVLLVLLYSDTNHECIKANVTRQTISVDEKGLGLSNICPGKQMWMRK